MTSLFAAAAILFFVGIDLTVQKVREKREAPALSETRRKDARRLPLRIPEGILFAKSHTWVSLFPSGKARVGVDDFVTGLLERADVTLVRDEGDLVIKGEALIVLAENGQTLTVRAPLSGKILSVNMRLEDERSLRHADLFGSGWAYTILPSRPEEIRDLLIGNESKLWMAEELSRLHEWMTAAMASGNRPQVSVQDGGAPMPGALLQMGPDVCKRFEQQFLEAR